jgi:hypothetical protein
MEADRGATPIAAGCFAAVRASCGVWALLRCVYVRARNVRETWVTRRDHVRRAILPSAGKNPNPAQAQKHHNCLA